MNGIYIEYSKLTPHHIEWLDKCGAKWAGIGAEFSKYNPCETHIFFIYLLNQWVFKQGEVCSSEEEETHIATADEFCQGVAVRLGIGYKAERTDTTVSGALTNEYFQKKLADKLAEHARADAGFPQKESDISKDDPFADLDDKPIEHRWNSQSGDDNTSPPSPKEKVKYKHITDQLPDTRKEIKEEVKYKHLRQYLIQTNTPGAFDITNAYCEKIIRAVLKDLPQEYVHQKRPGYVASPISEINEPGTYYQRIGSISEKVEIVKEGYV
jgi:hypothetical protein